MSTASTPATAVKAVTPALTPLETYINFFKQHESFLKFVIFLAIVWFGYVKFVDYQDKHATAQEKIASVAAVQAAQQAAQAQTNSDRLLAQYQADNALLIKTIAARAVATQQQQQTDRTAPLPDVAVRISTLAGFDAAAKLTVADGGVTFNEAATRETAVALEQVPQLQADKAALTKMVAEGNASNVACQATVVAKNAEIDKNDKANKAEVQQLKDDARKSKIKWFLRGYVAGLLTRPFVKMVTGI